MTTVAKAQDANDGTFNVEVPPELEGEYNVILNVAGHDINVGKTKVDNTPLTAAETEEIKRKVRRPTD